MIYVLIAAGIFILDFFIKRRVDKKRKLNEEEKICGAAILLRKYYNEGATLNFLAKKPRLMTGIHTGVMTIVTVVFTLLLRKKGNVGAKLGMSLVVGGGMSNLHDRLTKKHVVDYFSFNVRWRKLRNVIFNISDIFIFAGALITALCGKKQ